MKFDKLKNGWFKQQKEEFGFYIGDNNIVHLATKSVFSGTKEMILTKEQILAMAETIKGEQK